MRRCRDEFGDVPSSIRRRIKDLSIKDLDKLTDVAYWHIYAEARMMEKKILHSIQNSLRAHHK